MKVKWTGKALSDLSRLYDFLALAHQPAAARVIQSLTKCPDRLLTNPRVGEKLEAYEPREVRKILIDHYEIRYEIQGSFIYVLRVWHTREDR